MLYQSAIGEGGADVAADRNPLCAVAVCAGHMWTGYVDVVVVWCTETSYITVAPLPKLRAAAVADVAFMRQWVAAILGLVDDQGTQTELAAGLCRVPPGPPSMRIGHTHCVREGFAR